MKRNLSIGLLILVVLIAWTKRDCDFLSPINSQDEEYTALLDSVETIICDAKGTRVSDTVLIPAMAFYDEDSTCRHLWMQARCHYLLGSLLYGQDKMEQATAQLLQALNLLDTHFDASQAPVGRLYSKIHFITSRIAHIFSDEQSSTQLGRLGLDYATAVNDTSWMLRSMANLGILYERFGKAGEGDSAYYYCDGGLAMTDARHFPYETAMLENALANSLRHSHQYDSALLHFERSGELIDSTCLLYYRNYLEKAFVYYKRKDYASAVVYLEKAFESGDENIRSQSAFGLADCYEEIGDTLKAMPYYNIVKVYQEKQVLRANRNGEAMPMLNAYLRDKTAPNNSTARIWITVAIGMLIMAVFLFYHRRYKRKVAEQHEEIQRDLQEARGTIEAKELETLRLKAEAVYHDRLNNTDKRIMEVFNGAYPEALAKLKATYPDLNETELDICVLSFFDFRVKEMADILDLRENTVAKYRSNIKKKTKTEAIEDLLARLLA